VEVKALTDICCTSSNALDIIKALPEEQKILFVPDRNLGSYINRCTGRGMKLWNGACLVHEEFSAEKILALKVWDLLKDSIFVFLNCDNEDVFLWKNLRESLVCVLKEALSQFRYEHKLFWCVCAADRPEAGTATSCHYYAIALCSIHVIYREV
jgi:hypothetical protein